MNDSQFSLQNELPTLHRSPTDRAAAAQLVEAVRQEGRNRMLSSDAYEASLAALGKMRGLPMIYPLLAGGAGEGAWVQLADGRRILDMVSGIGPYVFGHDDQDLLETAAVAAAADVAFQTCTASPSTIRATRIRRRKASTQPTGPSHRTRAVSRPCASS